MTTITLYQLDAFTDRPFGGNPAAVCPLDEWLPDDVMQSIALENNLSETAFFVPEGEAYRLRWFTPAVEVDLCGHATLATASVMFDQLKFSEDKIVFETRSGRLEVTRNGDMLIMDFPALPAQDVPLPEGFEEAMGFVPDQFLRAVKNMAVVSDEAAVRAVEPNLDFIKNLDDGMGLIITAPGDNADCASRYFAPKAGIDEDPVTGSAHCTIVPFWSERLGKRAIHAQQVSARQGDLFCEISGDRVTIGGRARLVIEGTFKL